jgi:ABC-type sulfate transport system permease component
VTKMLHHIQCLPCMIHALWIDNFNNILYKVCFFFFLLPHLSAGILLSTLFSNSMRLLTSN